MNAVLQVRELSKRYGKSQPVVNGVSFEVFPREIFTLLGPSGCGKTTTLRLIGGFERPDQGEVYFAGRRVSSPGRILPPEARGIGFVFQDYALFPHLSVLENVMFGLQRLPFPKRKERALEVLDMVGLVVFKDQRPGELSGGQQQRVALARAIAPKPPLVLLDEPFSSLDANLRQATREEMRALLKKTGMSAVLVTHDQEEALSFADRIGVMRGGKIEQVGTPEEVYHRPKSPFVAHFLGRTNLIKGHAKGGVAETPLGLVRLAQESHGAVLLSLRPEHLDLRPATEEGGVAAKVLERAFKGHDLTYRVEAGGQAYLVQTDYRSPAHPGDQVRLVVREPAVVVGRGEAASETEAAPLSAP